jgi:hypothetical protein
MRAILPETEGKILEANLQLIVDEQYLRDHPERARVAGQHNIDRMEQRLADAFIEAINGEGVPTESTRPDDQTETAKPDKKLRKRTNKTIRKGRTAVIVTISLEDLEAQILGHGPIDTNDALGLLDQLRTHIYFCVRNAKGAVMKFGKRPPLRHLHAKTRHGRQPNRNLLCRRLRKHVEPIRRPPRTSLQTRPPRRPTRQNRHRHDETPLPTPPPTRTRHRQSRIATSSPESHFPNRSLKN